MIAQYFNLTQAAIELINVSICQCFCYAWKPHNTHKHTPNVVMLKQGLPFRINSIKRILNAAPQYFRMKIPVICLTLIT